MILSLLIIFSCIDLTETPSEPDDGREFPEVQQNSGIRGLKVLLDAMDADDHLADLKMLGATGKETGYLILLASGQEISIPYRQDGAVGQDAGNIPEIGVKLDYDDNDVLTYYWTLGSEWLSDDNGSWMKVLGADSFVPGLKIEGGYRYVSCSSGEWRQLDKVTAGNGNLFNTVPCEDCVFVLGQKNEEVLTFPVGEWVTINVNGKDVPVKNTAENDKNWASIEWQILDLPSASLLWPMM